MKITIEQGTLKNLGYAGSELDASVWVATLTQEDGKVFLQRVTISGTPEDALKSVLVEYEWLLQRDAKYSKREKVKTDNADV